MKIMQIAVVLVISLTTGIVLGKDEKLTTQMQFFYQNLLDMKPYMTSYEEFKDPKNKEKVRTLIKNLEKRVEGIKVDELKAPGFSATYDLMGKHLRNTSYLFEREIYDTAWNNFRATTQFCIACHERLPKNIGKISWPVFSDKNALPASLLKEADFLYIGHQFDQSLEIYNQLIRKFKSKSPSGNELANLDTAYQRKIAFFARIQREPEVAVESLKQDLKNQDLPLETKKNIETWIHYFEVWKKDKSSDPSKLSDANLILYAKDIVEKSTGGRRISVSDPYIVNLLRVSGLLYERIFQKSKSSYTPEMLYLLGKCERDLAPLSSYSLADIYFRDCIYQAPRKPIAKKCFSEYELSMKQKFRSGASEYIDASLEEMRKMIQ